MRVYRLRKRSPTIPTSPEARKTRVDGSGTAVVDSLPTPVPCVIWMTPTGLTMAASLDSQVFETVTVAPSWFTVPLADTVWVLAFLQVQPSKGEPGGTTTVPCKSVVIS